jgi:acyl carrier protein
MTMNISTPPPDALAIEVRRLIAHSLHVPLDEVTLDRRLDAAGLGVDSLGLIKLNVAIEERFDIAIPDFVAEDPSLVRSVRDVVELVRGCVAKAAVS